MGLPEGKYCEKELALVLDSKETFKMRSEY